MPSVSRPRSRLVAAVGAAVLVASGALVLDAGIAVAAPLPSACTATGDRVTCTFDYTGAEQTFVVPAGVSTVDVVATGAGGSDARADVQGVTAPGGRGATVSGQLGVVAGSTLYVEVGERATCPRNTLCSRAGNGGGAARGVGGSNGSGGGASDVRTATSAGDASASLTSRQLVAGGGGGAGNAIRCDDPNVGYTGGAGGDAGAPGTSGTVCFGPTSPTPDNGGRAAAGAAGGAGGSPGGEAGTLGQGGDSGTDAFAGGGGGGGYAGGGGGGGGGRTATFGQIVTPGGGGGGSNLVPTGGAESVAAAGTPARVLISYAVPAGLTVSPTSGGGQSAPAGSAFPTPLQATVRDAVDRPAAGRQVVFTVTGGSATFPNGSSTATVPTGTDGVATSPTLTAGSTAGPVTVTATTAGGTTATYSETVTAAVPATITAVSGGGQSVPAGAAFPAPLVAGVADRSGRPSAGAPVTFTVTGPAAFAGGARTATVSTGSDGRATAPTLIAGTSAGSVTVTATTPGVAGAATFTETVGAASADVSVTLSTPSSVRAGTPFTFSVTVRNAGPSPVSGATLALDADRFRITAAPGALAVSGGSAAYRTDLAAGRAVTYQVTATSSTGTSGSVPVSAAVRSAARDAQLANNVAAQRITVTRR